MKKIKKIPAAKMAEELEREPIESEAFSYILESHVNGQSKQALNLFRQLENHSQYNFLGWLRSEGKDLYPEEYLSFLFYLCQKLSEIDD